MWYLTASFVFESEEILESLLIILIFDQIDKWIYCAIEKYHYDTKFEVGTIPVGIKTKIKH